MMKGVKKMQGSITVYYEGSTQTYSIYVTNKQISEAHTSNGKGIYFELSKAEADELSLKLAYEEQLSKRQPEANWEMTQEEANKEQVMYDEKSQYERDAQ